MSDPRNEWLDTSEPMVCVTHKRFIPCRTDDGCVLSTDRADVEAVNRYQRGDQCTTVTCPCPICGTTIPLTVHQISTLTVMVDRTDLAAHLLTHEETR